VFLADESADAAYMIHVGMNIADKVSLANEVHRVLAPGGVFGIYDLMAGDEDGVSMLMPMGEGALRFPLPFADGSSTAFVDSPALYREVFEKAGFEQVHHVDRTDYALKVLRAWKGKFGAAAPASSPLAFDELNQPLPPLGLHLVMGPTFREKMTNSLDALEGGRLEAHEMIFKKADA
jgi:SAM-dependent methyltransferase